MLPLVRNRLFLSVGVATLQVAAHYIEARDSPTVLSSYHNWTSIGCYADNIQGRILHHLAIQNSSNTVERCLDLCGAGGFALGGVEFGDECYCGNSLLFGTGTSQACSKPCAANPLEVCGGSNAINVYQNGGMPFTTGPAAEVVTYNGWLTAQCWEDDPGDSDGRRLLPHNPTIPIPAELMTVERCIDGCAASHFTSAGLEFGQECWCGNVTYPPGQFTSIDECEKPCLGNATEFCGGSARALLYSNLPQFVFPSGGWSTRGCVIDDSRNGGQHPLQHQPVPPIPANQLTVQGCIDACIASGFNSAGLYDGQQCWCDEFTPTPGVFVDDSECNVGCGGDPFQICGGQDRMLVYADPVIPVTLYQTFFGNWTLSGCFVDDQWENGGPRLLPNHSQLNIPNEMTAQACMDGCWFSGWMEAGLELGSQCWCANTTDASGNIGTLATPAECLTTPCTGAINEACGGVDRVLVYQFKGMLEFQPSR